jgi:Tfp pilus assembly PilM family ATPase
MASRVFAVDLGTWSVKLAIATPGLRGATLLHVVERLVPPGDEPVEDRARQVLTSLVEELRLHNENGYIGVYGDQVFTQVIEFGFKSLRRSELDKAVGGELEGVVPVDLEDMVYTFEPLPPVAPAATGPMPPEATRGRVAPPAEGMRVLTYAMRRERAEQLIQMANQCGFSARGVLACGGAAVRLVERTPSLMRARTDGAVAVIDIGHDRTDVVVVAQGKAVFSRSVARAGKQVTEAIMRQWNLPWIDAERAKHSDGFIASQAEPPTSDAWARIHQATVAELQPLARDLRQTLAACRARTGFTVAAALLVGGGSRLRGLSSFMTEQLAIPAWRIGPEDAAALAGPRLAAASDSGTQYPIDSAAMTIGMAYDAAGGRPQFDLRSGALAVKVDLSFLRAKALPLGAALIAILAFASVSAYANLYRLRKAEKTLTTRINAESPDISPERKPMTADQILAMSTGKGGPGSSPLPRASAYDILLEISAKVPTKDKILLDVNKLDISDKKVELAGTVKTPKEIDLLIGELKNVAIGEHKCFTDIKRDTTELVPASGDKPEHHKFKLTITAQCM